MNVNGITSQTTAAYSGYTSKTSESAAKKSEGAASEAAVYESSSKSEEKQSSSKAQVNSRAANADIVASLQSAVEQRTSQLRSIVEQMISKQGSAIGKADDMWKFLAGGNFTVDAATKAQAQADIAEDGYWGVEQTSDRILDFAKALSGGNSDKMEEMLDAFKKGFKQATASWGKELPDISQRTYDKVLEKFQNWQDENTVN